MNQWFNAKVIASIPIFIASEYRSVWRRLVFDISTQSMPLILGIIAGGLVDLDNRLTGRLKIFFTINCRFLFQPLSFNSILVNPFNTYC